MEAVVSRMKTVQVSTKNESHGLPVMRFMAISATIPNVDDVCDKSILLQSKHPPTWVLIVS